EVVGDGQGGWPRADQGDSPPVLLLGTFGSLGRMLLLWSAATRFSRQMATGLPSMRVLRQAGSQGRSQVLPKIPGKTFDSLLTM
ncbi:MAG TPA: hypothetical protein PLA92_12120, partial [Fimbriimonadaceae bacterium]|nr:hypothetical protein [Fimbriimonadaceae bacterium]